LALAHGWNPMMDWTASVADRGVVGAAVTHYPKGAWVLAASIYRSTNRLETGKAFTILFAVAMCAYLASLALRTIPERPKLAVSLALLASINPIVASQPFTFSVDGMLACIVVSLGCVLVTLPKHGGWLARASLASLVVLAVDIKFTGVVYALVLGMAAFGLAA